MNDQATTASAPSGQQTGRSASSEQILRMVYTSEATEDMTTDDLWPLLRHARRYNSAHGVGGLLLYKGRRFIQVVEGAPKEVHALMKRIRRDSRHRNVRVMMEDSQGARLFKDWSMAFMPLDSETEGQILGSGTFQGTNADQSDPGTAMVAGLFKRMVTELETEAGRSWNP